jgi:hypothetical protein
VDILLTQMRLSGQASLETAHNALTLAGSPHSEVSVFYQSVAASDDFGLVQYFHEAIEKGTLSPISSGRTIAQYQCREVSDTGPTNEVASVLMIVAFSVPEHRRQNIDDWYRQEHIPLLMQADGWLRARRYETIEQRGGAHYTSLALHELRNEAVLDSSERKAARSTPWRAQFSNEPWFENAGRWVYRNLSSDGPYFG